MHLYCQGKKFLTTRLLIESKRIDDIAGVIGHEIGHIIGGHFTQRLKAMEQSSMINIISSILAAGAMAAGAGQQELLFSWEDKTWNWKTFHFQEHRNHWQTKLQ